MLTDAVEQAQRAGSSNNNPALLVGLVISSLITACSLLGQVERGLNRLYGIEQDRPTIRKYGRAFVLSVSAGALIAAAFAAIALGQVFATSLGSDVAVKSWNALRWPVGLLLAIGGIALLFRWSPRRHQPAWSWLTYGAFVGVALWMLASIGLGVFFQNNSSFGDTYGSLAGLVALLLWAFATSVAILYGGAMAAQLEAIRAGDPAPLDGTRTPDTSGTDREMVRAFQEP